MTQLSLSAKGLAIYTDVVPLALHLEKKFLSVLSEDERKSFDALLTKLSSASHKIAAS